jgi:hypothetical protein
MKTDMTQATGPKSKPAFSAPEVQIAGADPEACAARLLGIANVSATPASGGGNNRIYRINTGDYAYAIKFYPRQAADPRDRLGQEFAALELMAAHGINYVPQPIAKDTDAACAMYQWIDGTSPAPVGNADIDAMTTFAKRLVDLCQDPAATKIAPASASCFAGIDSVTQFAERLARLRSATDNTVLHAFLNDTLVPAFTALSGRARERYADAGLDFERPLSVDAQTLSPSDFSFHNAIRRVDGTLAFIDFEYFGWDDPVKMIADVIWHPGSALESNTASRFSDTMIAFFQNRDGDTLRTRFDALNPLFGMIWCLIQLNEFLPERWARRVAAGNSDDFQQAGAKQLQAARALFKRVSEYAND